MSEAGFGRMPNAERAPEGALTRPRRRFEQLLDRDGLREVAGLV
ncbi:MAG: hypothetical protein JWO69_1592, partial [Thermoleophilia bacterium]|nr:hypothetical protein [Thermoleophilia bacterium]